MDRYTVKWTLRYRNDPNRVTIHLYMGLTLDEAKTHQKTLLAYSQNVYEKEWDATISMTKED